MPFVMIAIEIDNNPDGIKFKTATDGLIKPNSTLFFGSYFFFPSFSLSLFGRLLFFFPTFLLVYCQNILNFFFIRIFLFVFLWEPEFTHRQ